MIFGTGPVVGQEEDERVLERAHRIELIEHPADLAIHSIDHRRVDRHLRRLEMLAARSSSSSQRRPVHLVRAESPLQLASGNSNMGSVLRIAIRQLRS